MANSLKYRDVEMGKLLDYDLSCNKRMKFLEQARRASKFLNNEITAQDMGVGEIGGGDPFVSWNSIRSNLHQMIARAFNQPVVPRAISFEGKFADDDMSSICACIWKFEASSKRGLYGLNPMQEMKRAVETAFWKGCGYWDARIDEFLGDERFPFGLPVYTCIEPESVILDGEAYAFPFIRRLTIRRLLPAEIVSGMFGIGREHQDVLRRFPASEGIENITMGSTSTPAEPCELMETQYMRTTVERLILLEPSVREELGLPDGAKALWENDLKALVRTLKTRPEYEYLRYEELTKNLKKMTKQRASWFSFFHSNKKVLHEGEYELGSAPTLVQISFFTCDGNPYSFGVPYYLFEPVRLQMILETQKARLATRLMRRGAIYAGKASPEFKKRYEEHRIGQLLELGLEDLPEGRSLQDVILFEDVAPFWMPLLQYSQQIERDISRMFYNHPSGHGEAPYAQASGTAIERLQLGEASMYSPFRERINRFLTECFDRMLHLAVSCIPIDILETIAGENDERRKDLIRTGNFYQRVEKLNASVELDMETDMEKAERRRDVAALMMRTGTFTPRLLSASGITDEPYALAQEIVQNQEALRIGTMILEDPNLRAAVLPKLMEYQKQKDIILT